MMTLMTMMIAFLWWGVALNQPDLDDYEWLWMTVMRNSLCLDNQPHLQLTIFIHITRWQLTQLHPQLMQLIQFTQLNATACKLMQLCAIPHATSYSFTPSHAASHNFMQPNATMQLDELNCNGFIFSHISSPQPKSSCWWSSATVVLLATSSWEWFDNSSNILPWVLCRLKMMTRKVRHFSLSFFFTTSPAGIFEGWLTYCGGSGGFEANLGK